MALQLNTFSTNILANNIRTVSLAGGTNAFIILFSGNVVGPVNTAPSSPLSWSSGTYGLTLAIFSNLTTATSNGVITITGGNLSTIANNTGNVGYFAFYSNTAGGRANGALTSDYITLAGGGGILTLNTLSTTQGQAVTIGSFNLTITGL